MGAMLSQGIYPWWSRNSRVFMYFLFFQFERSKKLRRCSLLAIKMNRVSLVVCQLLLMLLKCDCDSEWTRNAIFVTVEIEDEPMDNSLVEQLQKLSELGVDGVIISNSFSLMRVKSSTTSEMSKLDELFLLLAEV